MPSTLPQGTFSRFRTIISTPPADITVFFKNRSQVCSSFGRVLAEARRYTPASPSLTGEAGGAGDQGHPGL